jgi:superfamily II DNA or RNA helicase
MSAAYMQYRHDAKHRKEKIIHGRDTISFAHATTPATYIRPWGQGLAITDAELRLQVAVIADGHFSGNTTRCVMRLKKERKVERLREILKETGIAYVETTPEYESAEGFHIFKFDSPIKLKEFDERFYKCSAEQIDIIYNEVLHWDGCIRKGIKANEFSSTSRVSADFVQMVFNSKGHIARITEDKRENRNTCYNVTIRELGKQHLGYYSTTTKTVFDCKSTDGFKYCFTVPSTFLLFRRNGCVFASGNTGKTMSVIWAADYLMTKKVIKRVLVICPLSIMDPAWRADLFKTAMHRRVDIAHGAKDKRIKVINSDAEFVIINYDGIEIVANEIAKGGFDLIVCDEASALKTPTTNRWKTLNSLINQHTWLWLLTGTPAAQSPMDAYGLAKMLRPDSVPRYIGAFRDQVMIKLTQFKYVPRPEAQKIVHKVLQPAIRYTKEECLDLPELVYTERDTPITPQQRKYYDLLKKEMLFEAAGEEVSAVNAAVKMNKLLQISSGAAYTDTGEVIEFDCSVRLKEMVEIVQQSSHKTLIFANFKHGIVTIKRHLDSLGITSEIIHGGVSANNRTKIFNKFQMEKDPQVLIIQPKAAAHGVTLHAANTIIWWGPITSTETYLQANARVHRQGQKNPCTVVHLVGSAVERSLYTSLSNKTEAQNTLLNMYKNIFGLI